MPRLPFAIWGMHMLEELLHWVGYGLCHQLPARSFFGGSVQVPVCARDTGLYVGFVVSLALIAILERHRRPAEPPPWWLSVVGLAFLGSMVFDGLTSYAGLRTTSNDIRLATGILAGFSLTLLLAPILNGQIWSSPGRGRLLDEGRRAAVWLSAPIITFAVVWWGGPLLGVAYPLLVGVSILLTFGAVNLAIVCLLPPFENRVRRLREAWPAMVWAGLFTLIELGLASLLRMWLEYLIRG